MHDDATTIVDTRYSRLYQLGSGLLYLYEFYPTWYPAAKDENAAVLANGFIVFIVGVITATIDTAGHALAAPHEFAVAFGASGPRRCRSRGAAERVASNAADRLHWR